MSENKITFGQLLSEAEERFATSLPDKPLIIKEVSLPRKRPMSDNEKWVRDYIKKNEWNKKQAKGFAMRIAKELNYRDSSFSPGEAISYVHDVIAEI